MITVSVSSPLIASSMVSSTHPSLSFTSNNIIIIIIPASISHFKRISSSSPQPLFHLLKEYHQHHPSLSFTSNDIIIIIVLTSQESLYHTMLTAVITVKYILIHNTPLRNNIYLTLLLLRNPLQKSIISTQFLTIGLKTAAFISSGQNLNGKLMLSVLSIL